MGSPMSRPPLSTLKSANDKPTDVRRCYKCKFVIDGHHGRGHCTKSKVKLTLKPNTNYVFFRRLALFHMPLFRRLRWKSIALYPQQCIKALIVGSDGTAAHLDDMLVTGRTIDEHNTRLDTVIQRIHDNGFRVRLEKLKTDLEPLVALFESKKETPVYSASRLQRWATMLLYYKLRNRVCQHKGFWTSGGSLTSHSVALINAGGLRHRQRRCRCNRRTYRELSSPSGLCQNNPDCYKSHVIKKIIDYIRAGNGPTFNRNSPFWHYYKH
uniref:Reverse transcriptase domain-containing protein n=1 Tax=Haemonchus placei TaxID=6290 RepID=A0A0N4WG27_HAEPC